MYLAGTAGGARLWNVPDIGAARVDLVREARDGTRTTIGCGATLMDPIDAADPDHAAGVGNAAPDRAPLPPDAGLAAARRYERIAVLVGDFSLPEAAQTAATAIRRARGIAASARIHRLSRTTAPVARACSACSSRSPPTRFHPALAAFRADTPGLRIDQLGW